VLVLWVLALLTVMALGLTTVQRTESALTRNQIDGARFRALADAALTLVVLDLLTRPLGMEGMEGMEGVDETSAWIPDGTPRVLAFDGHQLEVRLFNETSRLDLNIATREQLASLIELAQGEEGYDEALRDRLADAIIDWRDPDDLTQLNGAEDGDYESSGLPYGARDEPFRSVEELRNVLGMTRVLYQRLAPDLTVENPSGNVELEFASAAVISAVQGIAVDDARRLVEARGRPVVPDGAQARPLNRGGPLYRLRVSWVSRPSARRTMEYLFRLEGGDIVAPLVIWRRYGLAMDAPRLG
jgi:general secretion pathway protein K